MKKTYLFLLLFLFSFTVQLNAQEEFSVAVPPDKVSVGLGGGLDYGGLGASIMFYPVKSIGLFAGGGYAIAGFGVNAGAKFRLISRKPFSKLTPYAVAMYGYNAAVAVSGASELNKMFYGPSFGAGLDFRSRPEKRGYWSFALLIPVRSQEVEDYMDDLEQNHGVEFSMGLWPVGFSIGYRFILL